MEPESSLPYSQTPATCPYHEPTPSSPHNPFPLPEDCLEMYVHTKVGWLCCVGSGPIVALALPVLPLPVEIRIP